MALIKTNSLMATSINAIGHELSTWIVNVDNLFEMLDGYTLEDIKKYLYDKLTISLWALYLNEYDNTISMSSDECCIISFSVYGDNMDKILCNIYGNDKNIKSKILAELTRTEICKHIAEIVEE